MLQKAHANKLPTMQTRTFTFIVTESCQLRCKYCYLVGKNDSKKMPLEVARQAVDYIFSNDMLQTCDDAVFDFIGGEPLLEIELIDRTVTYIIEKMQSLSHKWLASYEIRITTNGILYSDKRVQKFIKKYFDHLSINISIDGNKQKNDKNRIFQNGRGSYDLIVDNVRLWMEQFPNEGTKMTISHEDVPYVFESLKHLVSLGIKKIDVNPVVENVWKDGDELIYQEQLIAFADYIIDNNLWNDLSISAFHEFNGHGYSKEQKLSPCGSMMLSIDADGYFYTCIRFARYSLRSKPPLQIGSIYQGLDSNRLRASELFYNDIVSPQECLDCDVASGCKWCPAESYDSSFIGSTYLRTTYSCKMHKAKVRAKNYYWNKLKMQIEND